METSDIDRFRYIEDIDWEHMNKNRFFVLSLANLATLRTLLYPLTVIKTNLQVQKSNQLYHGTFDAFSKIISQEGVRGLYRGFMVNSVQVVSGLAYIVTYEKMRHICSNFNQDTVLKGIISGGTSSVVSQTINTPFDVVSQHIMLLNKQKPNQHKNANVKPLIIDTAGLSRFQIDLAVVRQLYKTDGFTGFYRGYLASLMTYIPSSICFWIIYPTYSGFLCNLIPKDKSKKPIDLLAGSLTGASVAIITNAFDVIRVNIQVRRMRFFKALTSLWQQDGLHLFYKGLSARLPQSAISSACIAFGYETVKRYSIREEYKDKVRW